jgi:signal transduction histidine kinase
VSTRPLDRLSSIRAKLGLVIVFAVGMTVLLAYLLLAYALRNSTRDTQRLELFRAARAAAISTERTPPAGVTLTFLDRQGVFHWSRLRVDPPRFLDGGVHQGTASGLDYAAVPLIRGTRYVGTVYAVRRVPSTSPIGRIAATFGFLRSVWWQLLVGGALAAGIALVLARLLSLGMTRPLREMARAAGKMAHGDYRQRVHTTSRDEVGQLARTFNRMSADLDQLERLRHELVANVSHELKTPISALRAHLENLLDGVEQPDRATLQLMLAQSERLSRLVEQLLDLSRLESGDVPFERDAVELAPLVSDVVNELQMTAGDGVRLVEEVPDDVLTVWADRERLHQVLFNLIDNAVRFSPEGGSVIVSAVRRQSRCEIRVADTGPGIPAEHLAHVFERFYRVDPARTRGDGGTGIGLAIARSIVEAHDGRIWAESKVGRGSVFAFDLPLAGPPKDGPRSRHERETPRPEPPRPRIPTTTGGIE